MMDFKGSHFEKEIMLWGVRLHRTPIVTSSHAYN